MGIPAKLLHRTEAGIVGGLFAGTAVAMLFLVEGTIRLHPFAIPVALASGLIGGASTATTTFGQLGSIVVIAVEVLAYTVIHLLTFAAVGVVGALIFDGVSFSKSLLGGVVYGSVACTGVLYVTRWAAGTPVALDVVGLKGVLIANAMAGAIIGLVLYLSEHGDEPEASTVR